MCELGGSSNFGCCSIRKPNLEFVAAGPESIEIFPRAALAVIVFSRKLMGGMKQYVVTVYRPSAKDFTMENQEYIPCIGVLLGGPQGMLVEERLRFLPINSRDMRDAAGVSRKQRRIGY